MDGLVEIFLFFGVLFYLFNYRAPSMVDILSTRLQGVYAKWESRTEVKRNPESSTTTRFSLDELRRAGQQLHRRKMQDREQAIKIRENSLYKIKETEPMSLLGKDKPSYLHYCCNICTPASRNSFLDDINKHRMPFGLNVLIINPGLTFFSKAFNCISHIYRYKEFDYPKVTQTILRNERLKEAIELTALESVNDEGLSEHAALAKARQRAKLILRDMESKPSNILLKITVWILYKLLPCFIQSAVILPSQLEMLKKANETGLPLVFIPLHRSHLDYIIISFLLLSHDIRVPLIAAGDNLKIPFVGWFLRGLGAFFIKRRMDPVAGRKDILYRAILHTYVMENLRAGHNLEFFIEGGRTRTGKPCMPKGGILSAVVDAYMDGAMEDALLIPVAMNYERIVDGDFVKEQLGQPKQVETFRSLFRAIWSILKGNYGIIKIDFSQPFSLRETIESFQNQQNDLPEGKIAPSEKLVRSTVSSSSLYGTDVVVEEYRQLVDSIGRHVVHDCTCSMPIMSTNIVAFLLLNKFRDGCTLDRLIEAFQDIRRDLEYRNRDIAFCGENIDVIYHALDILGPALVKQQGEDTMKDINDQPVESNVAIAIRPVVILPNVIELSYYGNTMLLCYVMDSIVVTALYAELQSQINDPVVAVAKNNITIPQDRLIQSSLKLCDIFKYEFIFCKPCQQLEHAIKEAIRNLSRIEIIALTEECCLKQELWSRRYAQTFDNSSDEEYCNINRNKSIRYQLNLAPEHMEHMEFLHTLLRPLVDTYTCSAFTLRKLVGRSLSETDLTREIVNELKTNLDRGIINYGESLCVDPIKNSLKLFEKWNVLECYPQENVKICYLKDEYDTDPAVTKIYDTIAAFKWTRKTQ